jgi:hypothetical protein
VRRLLQNLSAAAAALALTIAPALARAESPAPVQGPWSGVTALGLPVHFTVVDSTVVGATFGFHWGFCGDVEGQSAGPATISPEGKWSLEDSRGAGIEGTVVAPDKIEGVVTAQERMTPSCPATSAPFTAIPGEVPPPAPLQYYAVANTTSGSQLRQPAEIGLGRFISFYVYHLAWSGWGEPVARATGEATVRQFKKEYEPTVKLTLSKPIADGPGKRLYSYLRFTLAGPIPPKYPRTGWFRFDRKGVVKSSDGRWPGGPGYVKHRGHKHR